MKLARDETPWPYELPEMALARAVELEGLRRVIDAAIALFNYIQKEGEVCTRDAAFDAFRDALLDWRDAPQRGLGERTLTTVTLTEEGAEVAGRLSKSIECVIPGVSVGYTLDAEDIASLNRIFVAMGIGDENEGGAQKSP